MGFNNSIDKRKILLISVGILAVVLAAVLIVWLSTAGEETPKPTLTDPTANTEDTGQTTGPPGTDTTDPPETDPTDPPETDPTDPPETDPTDPPETDPTDPPETDPTDPPETDPTDPPETDPTDPPKTDPTDPPETDPTDPPETGNHEDSEEAKLSCDKIAIFSGKFVEDGSDMPAEDVAALLVTNHSEQFLDLATIVYEIDGEKATFVVTGLPAGASCWVMEYTGLTLTAESKVLYKGCSTSFRDDAISTTDDITIRADGMMLTAVNNTDRTLENVFIYYKQLHSDGNYFGGITYMVNFGTLKPGQSVEKLGGHFSDDTEIVRIGWQEATADEAS